MADLITSPVFESPVFKKLNNIVPHKASTFDSDVARFVAMSYGVAPTMPFSSLADPEASSVADLLKSIPGVAYTPRRGVVLPDPASKLGELCGDFLNGLCTDAFCPLFHPPYLMLAGAVCTLMSRYCQPKAQPQPYPVLAGGKRTKRHREKMEKLRALFLNTKQVEYRQEPITSDEAFLRHCSKEWVQRLCGRQGPFGYVYYEGSDMYKFKSHLAVFQEIAEHAVNNYNFEEKENLEVKKVLKVNWKTVFVYMTIEAWDNRRNRLRTLQTAVWIKGHANFMVGFFKDVTVSI